MYTLSHDGLNFYYYRGHLERFKNWETSQKAYIFFTQNTIKINMNITQQWKNN